MSGAVEGTWLCREGSRPSCKAQGRERVLMRDGVSLRISSRQTFQGRNELWGHEFPGLEGVWVDLLKPVGVLEGGGLCLAWCPRSLLTLFSGLRLGRAG